MDGDAIRLSADSQYRVTIQEPKVFSRPWKMSMPWILASKKVLRLPMSNRLLDSVACALAVVLLAPAPVAGQSRLAAAKKWAAPRTTDGQPDLQGIWANAT